MLVILIPHMAFLCTTLALMAVVSVFTKLNFWKLVPMTLLVYSALPADCLLSPPQPEPLSSFELLQRGGDKPDLVAAERVVHRDEEQVVHCVDHVLNWKMIIVKTQKCLSLTALGVVPHDAIRPYLSAYQFL